jgi:hypothetical protein
MIIVFGGFIDVTRLVSWNQRICVFDELLHLIADGFNFIFTGILAAAPANGKQERIHTHKDNSWLQDLLHSSCPVSTKQQMRPTPGS